VGVVDVVGAVGVVDVVGVVGVDAADGVEVVDVVEVWEVVDVAPPEPFSPEPKGWPLTTGRVPPEPVLDWPAVLLPDCVAVPPPEWSAISPPVPQGGL
jgi:hypothetical protein